MDNSQYSQVNTSLAIRESQLLGNDFLLKLSQVQDLQEAADLLEKTAYPLTLEQLEDTKVIELVLIAKLSKDYQWAWSEAPEKELIRFFQLPYMYHNLKVLLKMKALKKDLKDLLIPIADYSFEYLEYVVNTFESDSISADILLELKSIWQEAEDYQGSRALEIGLDLLYFKDLKIRSLALAAPQFEKIANVKIEFYNLITVKRAMALKKPYSFIKQLLSDQGLLTPDNYINMVENGNIKLWLRQLSIDSFDIALRPIFEKIESNEISTSELEDLTDRLQFKILEEGKYTVEGPLPLARYLLACEFEVKNLRLILSALSNKLPINQVLERMRPIDD